MNLLHLPPMASSLESPEELYHAITHPDDSANASRIELDVDGEVHEPPPYSSDPPTILVDARIRWIHFILGCAVLLPWNGTPYRTLCARVRSRMGPSCHYSDAILSFSLGHVSPADHIRLLPHDFVYGIKLHIPCSCHCGIQDGQLHSLTCK